MSTLIADALREQAVSWFTHLRPRWVDIIGSYAGKELFLVDGDALVQVVLDDELLRLGRANSCDWQIAHAYWSVEATLHELRKRGAEFHIAFFKSNRPLAIGTSINSWIASARSLAHRTLSAYIHNLDFEVYDFENTRDEEWKEYVFFNKPLFILTNDHSLGDSTKDEKIQAANLLHRAFMKDMHDEGILVGSLRDIDFRDSQANTFLYDRKHKLEKPFPSFVEKGIHHAHEMILDLMEVDPDDFEDEDEEGNPVRADDVPAWPERGIRHYFSQLSGTPSPPQLALAYTFLAHVRLLDTIDLDLRAQPPSTLSPSLVKIVTEGFLPTIFQTLEETMPTDVDEPLQVDGRIYARLVESLIKPGVERSAVLGSGIAAAIDSIWKELELPPVDFGALAQLASGSSSAADASPERVAEFHEFALYEFSCEVLDENLSSVEAPVKAPNTFLSVPEPLHEFADSTVFARTKRQLAFRSPLPKHLGGEQAKPKDRYGMMKLLRKNQRDMVHIERQANSLTGAKGSKLEPEVIAPVGDKAVNVPAATVVAPKVEIPAETPEVKGAKGKKHGAQNSVASSVPSSPAPGGKGKKAGGKKEKEPVLKSADKLRMQIESQKKAKALEDGESWWKNRLDDLKNIPELKERIEMIDLQLRNNKRVESDSKLAANVWLYRINCECWHWIENPSRLEPDVKDKYVISLVKMVRGMRQYQSVLTATMIKCLWSVMEVLGFDDFVQMIPPPPKGAPDKKLGWDFIQFYRPLKPNQKGSEVVNAYPWMGISEDPVDWQLRAFGEHMDRSFDSQPDDRVKFEPDKWQRDVLDKLDRNESVLVVAPTSAGKTFISYYAMKQVLTSSDDGILVYVAPTKALVTQITAEVYARYRKDLKGKSCWAIHTADIRMNDPQKCQILVTVPEMLAFMLLQPNLAKAWTPRIKRIILDEIHTLGSQPGGVWEQILLLARCPIIGLSATVGDADAFNEWLKSIQTAHGHEHSLVLHHHRYSHLRKFIYNIEKDPDPFDGLPEHRASEQMRFLHPISFLRPGIKELPSDLALEARDCATLYEAMSKCSDDPALAKLKPTKFFEKLAKKGIFLQQADVIRYEEKLKDILTQWLQEEDAKESSSKIRRVVEDLSDDEKVKGWKDWHAGAKGREKAAQRAELKKDKAEGDKMERLQNSAAVDTSPLAIYANFDPDAPSEEFSFINWGTRYSANELDEDIKHLERYSTTPRFLLECLRRGLAVHHSGLPKGYRVLVESLFRIGFCRVVVSTEDLALGVNMPAKASVFCGDSPALNALMYRQCAGRAGRRGFDLLGKVVFYGIPNERVKQVVLSRLPALRGNYPLTPTLSLRLVSLLADSRHAQSAKDAVSDLLKIDKLTVGSDISRDQSLYNLRFSIEYLLRAQVMDSNGAPLHPWFNFASFLYTNEPANLALLALFREGYIHTICNDNMIDAKRNLMQVLSFLFCRQYISRANFDKEVFAMNNRTPSKVILPDLEPRAYEILQRHNNEVVNVFTELAVMYAIQHGDELEADHELPLSGRTVEATSTPSNSTFLQLLKKSRLSSRSRSSFVATSGHGDVYQSVDELSRTVRRGIHLTKHVLPAIELFKAESKTTNWEGERYLNAYLWDFYMHGQDKPLVDANGIQKSQIWYLLYDFSMALDAMLTAIKDLMQKGQRGIDDDMTSVAGESVAGGGGASAAIQEDWSAEPPDVEEKLVGGAAGLDVRASVVNSAISAQNVPLEKERSDEAETLGGSGSGSTDVELVRPEHVSLRDWKVYEVFWHLQKDFNEKFKAMWA
ncbi:hypothetical protein FRC19_011970 [Serendipita sp. 401]|nr:hypothetical protein FRC19_011970 [Serendipita sp. 401]